MSEQIMASVVNIGSGVVDTHPITGEKYEFNVITSLFQYKHDKQASAQVVLNCWRGAENVRIMTYSLETMNNFSLFALTTQYQELCQEWIFKSPTEHKITVAARCFAEKKGPVIKVGKREVKSLDLRIVEVEG